MGIAGTIDNSFFKAPKWVDLEKNPGNTSQSKVYPGKWWLSFLSFEFFFSSPNLVWFIIALLDYLIFPYDLNNASNWAYNWIFIRLAINCFIYFTYAGFWHLSLYWWGWAKRPFAEKRKYRYAKVLHNIWYSFLGVIQWTLWEAIYMHCYATNRLPYMKDKEIFVSIKNTVIFVAWIFLVPLWRSLHFYFAHRLLHISVLYKYVHQVHHRNTDIEPFSGLSMHPIEHLFYYSCVGPSLYFWISPFAFMWNGVHLSISPSASHSGWEDHFQSDQFHYLHHRFFECNYGTGDIPFDYIFGTFRDKLSIKDTTYKGEGKFISKEEAKILDSKLKLFGMPSKNTFLYYMLIFPLYLLVISKVLEINPKINDPCLLSLFASIGPIFIGFVILICTSKSIFKQSIKQLLFYPFHKEKLLGNFGINILFSTIFCIVPVYHTIKMLLDKPGNGPYFIFH